MEIVTDTRTCSYLKSTEQFMEHPTQYSYSTHLLKERIKIRTKLKYT